jgi:hypothetical protein
VKACTRFRHLFYRILFQCEILLIVFKSCAINLLRSYKNVKVRQQSCSNYAGCTVLCCLMLCRLYFNPTVISGHICVFGCRNVDMPLKCQYLSDFMTNLLDTWLLKLPCVWILPDWWGIFSYEILFRSCGLEFLVSNWVGKNVRAWRHTHTHTHIYIYIYIWGAAAAKYVCLQYWRSCYYLLAAFGNKCLTLKFLEHNMKCKIKVLP